MSTVPMFFRDCWWDDGGWWNGPLRTSRLLDQHFGRGLLNQEMFRAVAGCHPQELRRLGFSRPWGDLGHRQHQLHQLSAATSSDKEKFQINVDVQQFLPDEITVKTVDNCVVVEGKHDEKQDEHGFVTRHFVRRYVLPDDHDPKDVFSSLSSDGVLTITAPKKALPPPPPPPAANERVVPITKTEENAK